MTTIKKAIFREYIKYVSLSVVAMLSVSVYVLADTWFISVALGANGLTALNISIAVFSIVHSFGLMIGIGGATHYAIMKSKGENAGTVFTHALAHGLLISLVFVAVGMFWTPQVARLLGAEGEILPMAVSYMRTILLFSPVITINNILIVFVRNDNNPKLAMAAMVAASLSNILFDYIFLFPMELGMFGAGLATGLAFTLSLIVVSTHFLTKKNQLKLRKCKIRVKELLKIDSLGSSALINELAFAVSLVVFNLVILGIQGNIGVAAFSIVANIAILLICVFTGVAQGIQPLISRGHGTGDRFLVSQTLKYALITVIAVGFILYAATFFNANIMALAFNSEADDFLTYLTTTGLRIYFIGLVFAGINFIAAAFFSAIDSAKEAVAISLLRSSLINIPMVIVLGALFEMTGVWSAFVATEFVVASVSVLLLALKYRAIRSRENSPRPLAGQAANRANKD
ncbi:MAG: MATE family efflux transporter [Oscillospiraceae bacterium]|nr:MATE family efflux transporter [Oscillospiraceae bacterium]MCL2279853.1 MATE family efflux transporter [Oscillospiraceae bacterium]